MEFRYYTSLESCLQICIFFMTDGYQCIATYTYKPPSVFPFTLISFLSLASTPSFFPSVSSITAKESESHGILFILFDQALELQWRLVGSKTDNRWGVVCVNGATLASLLCLGEDVVLGVLLGVAVGACFGWSEAVNTEGLCMRFMVETRVENLRMKYMIGG
jgi:hypothetical protein